MRENLYILGWWSFMTLFMKAYDWIFPHTLIFDHVLDKRFLLARCFTTTGNKMKSHFIKGKKICRPRCSIPNTDYKQNFQLLICLRAVIINCILSIFSCLIWFLCVNCLENRTSLIILKTRRERMFSLYSKYGINIKK